jgi:hypothetical protein
MVTDTVSELIRSGLVLFNDSSDEVTPVDSAALRNRADVTQKHANVVRSVDSENTPPCFVDCFCNSSFISRFLCLFTANRSPQHKLKSIIPLCDTAWPGLPTLCRRREFCSPRCYFKIFLLCRWRSNGYFNTMFERSETRHSANCVDLKTTHVYFPVRH